jgi:hypothetical protein
MTTNVVTATMEEALDSPGREATLRRLHDWRSRVHALYDEIQRHLSDSYTWDRSCKQRSWEARIQQAGLAEDDVPAVDTLRIVRNGQTVAQLVPRMLWIIGANGRIDVIVTSHQAGRLFMLFDRSAPFANQSDWRIVRPADMLAQPGFHPEQFHELLE